MYIYIYIYVYMYIIEYDWNILEKQANLKQNCTCIVFNLMMFIVFYIFSFF